MTNFEPGDFVWVPFPFVEEAKTVHRPAMVLTMRPLGPASSLGWVIMVTNALRPGWPGDIDVTTWQESGLKIPSKIRTEKISTVDLTGVVPVGKADANLLESVRQKIAGFLG